MPGKRLPTTGYITTQDKIAEILARGTQPKLLWVPNDCQTCDGKTGKLPNGAECPDCVPGPHGTRLGFQGQCLVRREFEIFCGGSKGSGKSELGRMFMIKGNTHRPVINPDGSQHAVNISYIHHPHYLGLVLRKNANDLADWVERAKEFYIPLGAKYTAKPDEFQWPSGAKLVTGHLADAEAYEKYLSIEFTRILIEEAGRIPSLQLYLKVRSCCRVSARYPDLIPQIMLNANPEGPGMPWLLERFVEPKGPDGLIVPPKTTIVQQDRNPYTGKTVTSTRVFIPGSLKDNPYLMQDDTYVSNLATMGDKDRRAYLLGDWHAYSGVFFEEFRPRPLAGEPPNACHVVKAGSKRLLPWWYRWLGGDWGYAHNAAFYWFCQSSDDDRIHVYREMVVSQVGGEEIGAEIARRSLDELRDLETHGMTLYLSPDAFDARSEQRCIAELIAAGMARVLGPSAVHLPDLDVKRLERDREMGLTNAGETAFRDLEQKILSQQRSGITIRRAHNGRIAGWQYCRDVLRWRQVVDVATDKFDPEMAKRIAREGGLTRYVKYLDLFRTRKQEALPKLQIWDSCPNLISGIQSAQHDEKSREDVDKTDGDDEIDAWRYGLMGFRNHPQREPYSAMRDRRLTEYMTDHPGATTNDLIWVNRGLEEEWRESEDAERFTISRRSRNLRMRVQ